MTSQRITPPLPIIGCAEQITFAAQPSILVPAKIDTGADLSSVWATNIVERSDGLQFTLFAPTSPYYDNAVVIVMAKDYYRRIIVNSFGHKERRFVAKLSLTINNVVLDGFFSLADRSSKTYPVLLGRKLLAGNFLVDVAQGDNEVAHHMAGWEKQVEANGDQR